MMLSARARLLQFSTALALNDLECFITFTGLYKLKFSKVLWLLLDCSCITAVLLSCVVAILANKNMSANLKLCQMPILDFIFMDVTSN